MILRFFKNLFAPIKHVIPDSACPGWGDDRRSELEVRFEQREQDMDPIRLMADNDVLVIEDGKEREARVERIRLYYFPNGVSDWAAELHFTDGSYGMYPASARYWRRGRRGIPVYKRNSL